LAVWAFETHSISSKVRHDSCSPGIAICLNCTLDISAPEDLRSSGDRNRFYLLRGSGLLLIRVASAACLHEFAETAFGFEAGRAASDDYEIIVVNPRTLEIVDVIDD
jgi:hypothetical protein